MSPRLILAGAAVVLFVLQALKVSTSIDLIAWGLAALAAAHLVDAGGWWRRRSAH